MAEGKESQGYEHLKVGNPSAEAYARFPRELTRPITFGFKSGIRPTPPANECCLAEGSAACQAGLTARLEADVIVVECDWGRGSG